MQIVYLAVGRRWLLFSVTELLYVTYSSFLRDLPPVTGRPTADPTAQFFQLPSELTCPTILRHLSHENLLLVFSTRYTSFCCLNCVLGHVTCKLTGRGAFCDLLFGP